MDLKSKAKLFVFLCSTIIEPIKRLVGNAQNRFCIGLSLVVFFTLLLYAINLFQTNIDWEKNYWAPKTIVMALLPVGIDFKDGWYVPASEFIKSGSTGNTTYPPLVTALALGFTFYKLEIAYRLQIVLLFIANILTLYITARLLHWILVKENWVSQEYRPMTLMGIYIIAGLVLFMDIGSYGFLFSIERGNYDIYAILLSVIAISLLIRKPKTIWAQIIFLSIATHLKIYPAILFIPLFLQHRWKLFLPAVVVNLVLLFVLGPGNAFLFLKNLQQFMGDPYYWVGNHSALSFVDHIVKIVPWVSQYAWLFKAVPVLIWLVTVAGLLRKGSTPFNNLLILVISVPVMNVLPDVSHDYKLVILCVPLLIMVILLLLDFQRNGRFIDILLITLLLVDFLFIFQSYAILNQYILSNKYPFIVIFEYLVCVSSPYLSRNFSIAVESQPVEWEQGAGLLTAPFSYGDHK